MSVASRITVSTTLPSAAYLTWVSQSCDTSRTMGLSDIREASGGYSADPACTDAVTATADAGLTVGVRASKSEVERLGRVERRAAAGQAFTPPKFGQPIALSPPSGSGVRGVAMEVSEKQDERCENVLSQV